MNADHARLVGAASTQVAARNWEDAERTWARLAGELDRTGDREAAHGAFAAAGDAAFRADRPVLAVRHLVRAATLARGQPLLLALRKIQAAAAFLELGDPESTASFLDDAGTDLEQVPDGDPVRQAEVLLDDARVGLLLLAGRIARASEIIGDMARLTGPREEAVLWFRRGQVARIQGQFPEAVDHLSACILSCRLDPRFDGPRGAALLELAEVAILRGDLDEALDLLDEARSAWARAGRRSGVFRAEAARIRAISAAGRCEPLTAALDRAVEFAQERELRVLEAELRHARGICLLRQRPRAGDEDLAAALILTRQAAVPHLAGAIRLALHDRPGGRVEGLEQATRELEESPVLLARTLLAQARLLAGRPRSLGRALELCGLALCRFSDLGLEGDEDRARSLLRDLMDGV